MRAFKSCTRGSGVPNGLADRASVDTVLHSDSVTRPHRGDRHRDGGCYSGRNDWWRPRRIRVAPPQYRAVTGAPHGRHRHHRGCGYSGFFEPPGGGYCRLAQRHAGSLQSGVPLQIRANTSRAMMRSGRSDRHGIAAMAGRSPAEGSPGCQRKRCRSISEVSAFILRESQPWAGAKATALRYASPAAFRRSRSRRMFPRVL